MVAGALKTSLAKAPPRGQYIETLSLLAEALVMGIGPTQAISEELRANLGPAAPSVAAHNVSEHSAATRDGKNTTVANNSGPSDRPLDPRIAATRDKEGGATRAPGRPRTARRVGHLSGCTDAELKAAQANLTRHTAIVPLCHMEYKQQPGGIWGWTEDNPPRLDCGWR